ncbi:hypothetical protein HG530_007478 [Fusarium avenaceum]|nr:hypothetical protein HG530_007478 [Fusarium avenaceum]
MRSISVSCEYNLLGCYLAPVCIKGPRIAYLLKRVHGRLRLEIKHGRVILVKESLKDPADEFIRPQLGGVGLVYGGRCPWNTQLLQFFPVRDDLDLVSQVRDFRRRNAMDAPHRLPVTRNIVLGYKFLEKVESIQLELGYRCFCSVYERLTMAAILMNNQQHSRLSRFKEDYALTTPVDELPGGKSPRDTAANYHNVSCRGKFCRGAVTQKLLRRLAVPVRLCALNRRQLGLFLELRGNRHCAV